MQNKTCLVTYRLTVSPLQILNTQNALCLSSRYTYSLSDDISSRELHQTLSSLGTAALTPLTELLLEKLESFKLHLTEGLHLKIQFPALAFFAGCLPLSLDDRQSGSTVLLAVSDRRNCQRVAASAPFYGSKEGFHDSIIVESRDENELVDR